MLSAPRISALSLSMHHSSGSRGCRKLARHLARAAALLVLHQRYWASCTDQWSVARPTNDVGKAWRTLPATFWLAPGHPHPAVLQDVGYRVAARFTSRNTRSQQLPHQACYVCIAVDMAQLWMLMLA
jgi:hypothetical protein